MINIAIDGNALAAIGLSLLHSYRGFFQNVLVKNWGRNNATDTGVSLTTRATFAAVTVNGNENIFEGLQIEQAAFSTGTSLAINGCSYNNFIGYTFGIPGTGTGVTLTSSASGACKYNTFTNYRFAQQNTGTGTMVTVSDTGGTGTTPFTWPYQNDPSTVMWNGKLTASAAAGALTVALKTIAGNDPSPADPVWFLSVS